MKKTKKSSDRGSKGSRSLSTSEKADRLTAMIKQTKRDSEDHMTSNKPRKKKKAKAFDAFDMVAGGLPEHERDLIKGLVEDAEEDDSEEDYTSIFEKAFSTLHADASNPDADFRSEQAAKSMQRASLALILRMIPRAEENYWRSRKQTDAYAMNAFIDQARELSNDLRMLSDADGQVDYITSRILRPLFLAAGQTLLAEITDIKNTIDTELRDPKLAKVLKRKVDSSAMSLGKFWSEMASSIGGQLHDYLHGNTAKMDLPASINQKPRAKRKKRPSGED